MLLVEKSLYRSTISLCQFSKSPGQGFHNHVFSIINNQIADRQRSCRIALSASRFVVQGNSADDCRTSPPVIA